MSINIDKEIKKAILAQGVDPFFGVDAWAPKTMLVEQKMMLVQLDFRELEQIQKNIITASDFFTKSKTLENSQIYPYQYSARKFAESVQVRPKRQNINTGKHLYHKHIAIYTVLKSFSVVVSKAECNPQFGKGGALQLKSVIPTQFVIKNGYLQLKEILSTVDRENKLPLYQVMERLNFTDREIESKQKEYFMRLLKTLSQGNEESKYLLNKIEKGNKMHKYLNHRAQQQTKTIRQKISR